MKTIIIIAALFIIVTISWGCVNENGAMKKAESYLDAHYPDLHLTIVCMFSTLNEANLNVDGFAFLAVDKSGNEVTGSWDNKTKRMSDIQNDYETVVSQKGLSDKLKTQLQPFVNADVYVGDKPSLVTQESDAFPITIFCFNEVTATNKDSLAANIENVIAALAKQINQPNYAAQIIFVYKGTAKKTKPYNTLHLQDLYTDYWQKYDGYLEVGINRKKDKSNTTPIRLTGSSFLITDLEKKAWQQVDDKVTRMRRSANDNNIFVDKQPVFFMIDRNNLQDIFFLFERKANYYNNRTIQFVTGYYNLQTQQIHDLKKVEAVAEKNYKNKDLEYLIPESCKEGK